ncbi:MAG TPA: hypothetical protein VLU91_09550 [Nitrososphaerales archaeon]|nr:hypothetical protein [Nitrososphaerales archaeon]
MAWCRVSSLTAAVSRSLMGANFPLTRLRILRLVKGQNLEGWELDYFLAKALRKRKYRDLREVLSDLSDWLEAQG